MYFIIIIIITIIIIFIMSLSCQYRLELSCNQETNSSGFNWHIRRLPRHFDPRLTSLTVKIVHYKRFGIVFFSARSISNQQSKINIELYLVVSFSLQHPDYDVGSGFTPNDFSVVRLTSAASGTNISPATLAGNGNNPGGNGAITGWGRTCGKTYSACYPEINQMLKLWLVALLECWKCPPNAHALVELLV